MPRTRSLTNLIADVRKRADIEGATDRHPDADLTRYINQGGAELRDLMIEVKGPAFFRKSPPQTITTSGGSTTRYALSSDFYRLVGVRISTEPGVAVVPFFTEDEPWLRSASNSVWRPTHYQLQPGFIELLPKHCAGISVVVDYIPYFTDLSLAGDTLDGVDGWEEYVVCFAARCALIKDEELKTAQVLEGEMARLAERIRKLAPGRDSFRAERVKDVRQAGFAYWPYWRFR